MTESREDRISRIRAAVDDVRAIPPTDAAWLLEQIPTVFEYSVERGTRTFHDGPYVWMPWDGPYERQETAEKMAADRTAHGAGAGGVRYRVSRSPAPAWTPVEDAS